GQRARDRGCSAYEELKDAQHTEDNLVHVPHPARDFVVLGEVRGGGRAMISILRTIWCVFLHAFQKRVTVQYPEEKPYLAPRYRGRIILSRDPDGEERCVACNLCAVVCPVDCI